MVVQISIPPSTLWPLLLASHAPKVTQLSHKADAVGILATVQ